MESSPNANQDQQMETNQPGILNKTHEGSDKNKKMKPHVTWDEEQIAEHNKTRGQKMKIDEPKTPYVTDEEFRKLCEEDPDYQAELEKEKQTENILNENQIMQDIDINSQEAQHENDVLSDKDMQEFRPGNQMAMSDDETAVSPMKINDQNFLGLNDDSTAYFKKQQFAKSSKKACESSLNVFQQMENNGMGGGTSGGGLDISKLTGKLQEINDEEEESQQKKKAFEDKRKKHYANEFEMAKLLRQQQQSEDQDYAEEEDQNNK